MKNLLFVFACLLVLTVSCDRKIVEPISDSELGYQYAGKLSLGSYKIYAVDSVQLKKETLTGLILWDTSSYFIKEEVVGEVNMQGRDWAKIKVERSSDKENWRTLKEKLVSRGADDLRRREDGLIFIDLIFPASENASWDGNQLFDADRVSFRIGNEEIFPYQYWDYKILNTQGSDTIAGTLYDNLLQVEQVNSPNFLDYDKANEYYAPEIGLVYKKVVNLVSRCKASGNSDACSGKPIEEHANRGFVYEKQLVEHN